MTRTAVALWIALAAAVAAWASWQDVAQAEEAQPPLAKWSIPAEDALKEARKLVREAFKDRYAKTKPDDRKALCHALLEESRKASNGLVDEAASEDAFDDADKTIVIATIHARKMRNAALQASLTTRKRHLADLRKAFAAVQEAHAVLASKPDDPQANLTVGRYRCLAQGNWEKGLPALARCADPALKGPATADAAGPTDAAAQAGLADAWWALGEKEAEPAKFHLRSRAAFWYRQALPELDGLKQRAAQTRIEAVERQASADNALKASLGALVARRLSTLGEWDIQSGRWTVEKGAIVGRGDGSMTFKYPLPADLVLEFVVNVKEGMRPRIHFEGADFYLGNEGYEKNFNLFGNGIHKTSGNDYPYENGRDYKVTFRLLGRDLEVLIDGKRAFTGKRMSVKPFRLRLRGGDEWSKGTTCFSRFAVQFPEPKP